MRIANNDGRLALVHNDRILDVERASGGQFVTYGLLEKYDIIDWANWMKRAGCHNLYALGESLGAPVEELRSGNPCEWRASWRGP